MPGIGVEEVEAGEVLGPVGRLHRDAFRREPGLGRAGGRRGAHRPRNRAWRSLESRSSSSPRQCQVAWSKGRPAHSTPEYHERGPSVAIAARSMSMQHLFCGEHWPIVRHYHLAFGRPALKSPACPGIRVPHRLPDPPKTSAAAIWAPLARFIAAEARIGDWAEQRPVDRLHYEFVRFGLKQGWACLFGGAMVALSIGTHLLVSARRRARALRFSVPGGGRDPGRDARRSSWRPGGGQGHPRVPRRRHGHGGVQDRGRLLDLSGAGVLPHRRRAAVHRLHVCGDRQLHGALLAAVRFPLRASSAGVGGLSCSAPRSTSTSTRITTSVDIRYGLFAAAALLFGRTCIYFKVWRVHRRMPLLLGLFSSRCSSGSPRTSAPSPGLGSIRTRWPAGRWCRSASSARGSCC